MNTQDQLQATIELLVQKGKGILAADESSPTIAKRFDAIGVESTEEQRRRYRSLILETPNLSDYISGIILFEETLGQQTDDGTPLPELASRQGVVPGIKVDKGKGSLANAPGDEITRGLDGLEQRLEGYQAQGARFAKWRNVYHISDRTPSRLAVEANAEMLARYAAICQAQGIVPIVEPEVLMDGEHDIERCAEVSEAVLHELFHALHRHRVVLEHALLKPNMVTPGKAHANRADPDEVAQQTVRILRRTVPAALPSINFLSGGQSPEEATANLNAMNCLAPQPWELSFSYGRALQQPALQAWGGKPEQVAAAQAALYQRAQLNGAARRGEYVSSMESAGS
ncbi:class I fructose-bisphosphate aldolase [Sedimenticola hydrogenitrophicus]|uniref:class I fructose-bisphosphate aldolase n=1 Tax=Sedimenticola hydrogenitrophicus TaxID=2967975 RepID=UPI0021A69F6E|nr:class I fructose-bisphosphate aldolase [Sedimenticola hydrogenitrophicus]